MKKSERLMNDKKIMTTLTKQRKKVVKKTYYLFEKHYATVEVTGNIFDRIKKAIGMVIKKQINVWY